MVAMVIKIYNLSDCLTAESAKYVEFPIISLHLSAVSSAYFRIRF